MGPYLVCKPNDKSLLSRITSVRMFSLSSILRMDRSIALCIVNSFCFTFFVVAQAFLKLKFYLAGYWYVVKKWELRKSWIRFQFWESIIFASVLRIIDICINYGKKIHQLGIFYRPCGGDRFYIYIAFIRLFLLKEIFVFFLQTIQPLNVIYLFYLFFCTNFLKKK